MRVENEGWRQGAGFICLQGRLQGTSSRGGSNSGKWLVKAGESAASGRGRYERVVEETWNAYGREEKKENTAGRWQIQKFREFHEGGGTRIGREISSILWLGEADGVRGGDGGEGLVKDAEFQDRSGWVMKMGKRLNSGMTISGWSRVVAEKRNGVKVKEGGKKWQVYQGGATVKNVDGGGGRRGGSGVGKRNLPRGRQTVVSGLEGLQEAGCWAEDGGNGEDGENEGGGGGLWGPWRGRRDGDATIQQRRR